MDTNPHVHASAGKPSVNCPNCAVAMTTMMLDAHLSAMLEIDVCTACQAFWFDKYESLKLSPSSILQLMKLIGEHSASGPLAVSNTIQCPRCSAHLLLTNDLQRSTRFSYWRCNRQHGKFIRFFDFLKEKNFIRPMPVQQIEELRQNIQAVNCSNCGAPIDLATSSVCTHCGSAISMLDMNQAQQTLTQLKQAVESRPVVSAPSLARDRGTRDEVNPSGTKLVQDILNAVSKWLIGTGD